MPSANETDSVSSVASTQGFVVPGANEMDSVSSVSSTQGFVVPGANETDSVSSTQGFVVCVKPNFGTYIERPFKR